jgi:hypothetical protein
LPFSSRHTRERSAPTASGPRGLSETRGELRLRVLTSLPTLHQRYLFEEVRKGCSRFLRQRGIVSSEVSVEELLSEVWKKLLGSVSVQDEKPTSPLAAASENPLAPDRDGRVIWLIEEVGGIEAMSHRYEDILRQRHGRSKPNVGRPLVQPNGEDELIIYVGSGPPNEIEVTTGLVWLGLIRLAERRFPSDDDVFMLLELFKKHSSLFDECSSSQWPINEMVVLLNELFPEPGWRTDRVDNAKRRLVNWIRRLKQRNGLDQTDLEALFVRIARESNGDKREFATNQHLS